MEHAIRCKVCGALLPMRGSAPWIIKHITDYWHTVNEQPIKAQFVVHGEIVY